MNTEQMSFADVRKMRRGTNAFEKYNFPFTDIPMAIRVLTQDDILRAANKWREIAEKELTNANENEVIELSMRELLYKAVLKVPEDWEDVNSVDYFFASPSEVWELTVDEKDLLIEHYNEVQEKYAPQQTLNTPEDFDNLISELKKKSQIGMSLSTSTLRKLLEYMVKDMRTLLNDNGTTSMPVNKSNADEKKKRTNLPKVGISLKPKNT